MEPAHSRSPCQWRPPCQRLPRSSAAPAAEVCKSANCCSTCIVGTKTAQRGAMRQSQRAPAVRRAGLAAKLRAAASGRRGIQGAHVQACTPQAAARTAFCGSLRANTMVPLVCYTLSSSEEPQGQQVLPVCIASRWRCASSHRAGRCCCVRCTRSALRASSCNKSCTGAGAVCGGVLCVGHASRPLGLCQLLSSWVNWSTQAAAIPSPPKTGIPVQLTPAGPQANPTQPLHFFRTAAARPQPFLPR